MSRGLVELSGLVVLIVLAWSLLLGAAVGPAAAATGDGNVSLGADISSFMQASSVETADDVEDGRFQAAMNQTDDPEERRALIEARQERLRERNELLDEHRASLGETPDVRNRSVATRVSVGAAGLERSANWTERRAAETGVDTEALSEIRSNARTLRDPDVAELVGRFVGPPDVQPPTETDIAEGATDGPTNAADGIPNASDAHANESNASHVDTGNERGDSRDGARSASNTVSGVGGTNGPTEAGDDHRSDSSDPTTTGGDDGNGSNSDDVLPAPPWEGTDENKPNQGSNEPPDYRTWFVP